MKINYFKYLAIPIILLLAVNFTVNIGTEDYESMALYFIIGIIIYFLIWGWKNVWWFAAFLVMSGTVFSHGFQFEGVHLFFMMLMIASVISFVQGYRYPVPLELRATGFTLFRLLAGTTLVYAMGHFMLNYIFPYSPIDYNVKNCLKAYFEAFASLFILFWLISSKYQFLLKRNWVERLLWIILITVAGNVIVRLVMFARGFSIMTSEGFAGLEEYFLYVPIINMQAGIFTLRDLTPLSTVIVMMIATQPGWWTNQKKSVKVVVGLIIFFCILGAATSGGRATMVFCLALVGLVAMWRKQVVFLMSISGAGIIFVILINVFSTMINEKAPYYVARSLQFLMVNKGDAAAAIDASGDVRKLAHDAAYTEWLSENRIMFFGRSVFSLTHEEAMFFRNTLDPETAFILNAQRSGRTHGLITDLLIQYGAFGIVLYLCSYVAVIYFYFKLYRRIGDEHQVSKALAGAMCIYVPMILIYQLLGGQYLPSTVSLLAGLIRADLMIDKQS